MLKKILKLKVLLSLLSLTAATSWAAPKYPAVEEIQGSVSLTGKDGGKVKLTTKTPLQEKALFETSEDSTVRVALDGVRHFVVLPNSTVLLPTISWEGGEAPVLTLRSGSVRWVQKESEKPSYNTVLRTDLYEFLPPAGDFIFHIDSPKAYGEVKVLKGSIEFSALNGETTAQAKTGEQVGFQGMVEGGEIAYDVLLKGKKIPRGNLTPVTKISDKELASFDGAEKKRQAQAAQLAKKHQKATQAAKKSGAICSNPSARFNECSWVCVGNPKAEKKQCLLAKSGVSCQRHRCNANGDWAEETLLNAQNASINCKAQPVVAPCDY
ncbi:hypothetical protein ACLSU7_03160 [Bdellovibrio sp. HCB185ZH]|uniref:hypothetical protein n=1 Tax=Bdellovibrio sp. HCB185ZH TaxID=3394235 RepID=UPI0039A758A3